MEKTERHLHVVLKTVERCNINCTYCYFFSGNDQSFSERKPYINVHTIDGLIDFLNQGVEELGLTNLEISFHGGEPLMQKIDSFREMCLKLINSISPKTKLSFSIQTNAMLINDLWIDAFSDFNISVGVSIDGPPEYHDKYRVDFKNKGTHARVVEGIKRVMNSEKIKGIGSLTVINPTIDGGDLFNYLVTDLGFKTLDFLLPDNTHDNPSSYPASMFGNFLIQLFDSWVANNDNTVRVRFLRSALSSFFGKGTLIYGVGVGEIGLDPIIAIRNNGDLAPTDELLSTDKSIFRTDRNIFNTTLKEFLDYPVFKKIENAQIFLPEKCLSCSFEKICGGGGIVNRFSKARDFDNPSIYCEGLYSFYEHVLEYLLKNNFSLNQLKGFLASNESLPIMPFPIVSENEVSHHTL